MLPSLYTSTIVSATLESVAMDTLGKEQLVREGRGFASKSHPMTRGVHSDTVHSYTVSKTCVSECFGMYSCALLMVLQ